MAVTPNENIKWAVEQLRQKAISLGRPPQKEDFDDATRSRIKAFLGPWPRALEAAGLKEAKPRRKAQKHKRSRKGEGK